jgi:hypothetical protein
MKKRFYPYTSLPPQPHPCEEGGLDEPTRRGQVQPLEQIDHRPG